MIPKKKNSFLHERNCRRGVWVVVMFLNDMRFAQMRLEYRRTTAVGSRQFIINKTI